MTEGDDPLTKWPNTTVLVQGVRRNFDASFLDRDDVKRQNHGKPWSSIELVNLGAFFDAGFSLSKMCAHLGRPAAGVIPKLVHIGRITNLGDNRYVVNALQSKSPVSTKKATVTNPNAPVIETKTFIAGQDATCLSDEEIFRLIGKLEADAKAWSVIDNRPKKLDAMIEKTLQDVKTLVAFVDSRA